jgi:hypothetical protein
VRVLAQTVAFEADRFDILAPWSGGATLSARRLRFAGGLAGMTVALLEGEYAAAAPSLRLSAEAIALPPPPARQAAMGGHIASATAELAWSGTWAPSPDLAAAAAAWRDGGGRLSVRRVAVGWGPLGVTGMGDLALDAALQPTGSAQLRLVGVDATLAALVSAHAVAPSAAKAAGAVLGLMKQDEGGMEVPLTLRDRTLSVGPFPLAKLPSLVWPGAAQ